MDQRAGERHALALAAGQHGRPVAGAIGQAHLRERIPGAGGRVAVGEAQLHVLQHGAPGQQARFLEHDAHVVACGIAQRQRARRRRLQAGQQAQQGALAAAAAPDDGDELAGVHVQRDAAQHLAFAEALAQPG